MLCVFLILGNHLLLMLRTVLDVNFFYWKTVSGGLQGEESGWLASFGLWTSPGCHPCLLATLFLQSWNFWFSPDWCLLWRHQLFWFLVAANSSIYCLFTFTVCCSQTYCSLSLACTPLQFSVVYGFLLFKKYFCLHCIVISRGSRNKPYIFILMYLITAIFLSA